MSQFFASGGQNIGVSASASVLPMRIQDWFPLRLVWSPCSPRDSQESSPTTQFKSINSLALSFLYGPTLISIHNYCNISHTESQSLMPIRNLVENTWRRGFAACSCEDLGILAPRTFSSPLGLDLDLWLLLFSCSGVSNSLRHHGLQHARLPCSSLSPWASSNSCPLSWRHSPTIPLSWRHNPTISFSVAPFSFHPRSYPESGFFPVSRLFPSGGWSFSFSFSFSVCPSNKYSWVISFRIDWFDLLAVQGTLKSLLQYHSSKASLLWSSAFFMVQLLHPYMTTGKTSSLWLYGALTNFA